MFERKGGQKPPCATCPKPLLADENTLAWTLFNQFIATQPIVAGLGSICGFSYGMVPTLFSAYNIPQAEWPIYLDKFALLANLLLKQWSADANSKK